MRGMRRITEEMGMNDRKQVGDEEKGRMRRNKDDAEILEEGRTNN
jgi:hypothetical protein